MQHCFIHDPAPALAPQQRTPNTTISRHRPYLTTIYLVYFSLLTKDGGNFDEVLFGEVVTRINLKYEDMVDARRPPPIDVDANQEEEDDDEQWATEEPHRHPQVCLVGVKNT